MKTLLSAKINNINGGSTCICTARSGHLYAVAGVFNFNDCGVACCYKFQRNEKFASALAKDPVIGFQYTDVNKNIELGHCSNQPEGADFLEIAKFVKLILDRDNNFHK